MKTVALLTLLAAATAYVRPAPLAPVPCTMINGQPRPYPCEFQIVAMYLMGKNNEVLGTLKPGQTTVKLPKSKAVSSEAISGGEALTYNVSLDFRRVNTPSFSPPNSPNLIPYKIGTATVTDPLTTGEVTDIKSVNISPKLPKPGLRPNRAGFTLRLIYVVGNGGLVAPVQYVQIANPITLTKLPTSLIHWRDRAEAYMTFSLSVDPAK